MTFCHQNIDTQAECEVYSSDKSYFCFLTNTRDSPRHTWCPRQRRDVRKPFLTLISFGVQRPNHQVATKVPYTLLADHYLSISLEV